MDQAFPFGFPFPTAGYLTLYAFTLVVHVLFMNYVLAGTAYLAAVSLFTGGSAVKQQRRPMALVLRDWMPFAVSAAITTGVAPLLFVQILYQKNFYTANLLLNHRWMAILPVLIVGFYLLYLLKSKRIVDWSPILRIVVGVGAFLCFAFTGYSWTENYLLSVDAQTWPTFYATERMVYFDKTLLPRLAVWFAGSIPTLCTWVAWQLWYGRERQGAEPKREARHVALFALIGLALTVLAGLWYRSQVPIDEADRITGPLPRPWLILALSGLGVQIIGWSDQLRRGTFSPRRLLFTSLGLVATIVGITAVRESVRLADVNIEAFYDQHARAAEVGGFFAFLAFFVINAVLLAWCFWLVRRGTRTDQGADA